MSVPRPGEAGLHILLLDDAAPLRALLAELLEEVTRAECIVQVEDVISALDAVSRQAFDVAILDLNIPGDHNIRNGIDLARVIKKRHPATKVALLTALANPVDRNACIEAGADRFYDKGEIDRLLEWISESAPGE